MSFPQTPPLPDASPVLHVNYYLSLGCVDFFLFLSGIKRRKKYFLYYVSVKNQKSKKYTKRIMCFKKNESGSIFLWGREKYS